MKGYRNLIPIAMVVLMIVSMFKMVSDAADKSGELSELVSQARTCADQELYSKALGYYEQAIAVDKNIDLYFEVIDLYIRQDKPDDAEEWITEAINDFPEDPAAYEKKLDYCMEREMYSSAFNTIKTFYGRQLESEKVDQYNEQIMKMHYETDTPYYEITTPAGGFVGFKNDDLWGLGSVDGAIAVAADYKKISYFSDSLVAVQDEKGVWFFMDQTGEYQYNISASIEGNITEVGVYSGGLVPICVDGRYNYYNIGFEEQFGGYSYAGTFNGGVAAVSSGGEWLLIKPDGTPLTNESYSDIIVDERGLCLMNDRIFVKGSDGKYRMIDSQGQSIGEGGYDDAKLFANGDLAAVKIDGEWGFADLSGNIVTQPQYEDAVSYSRDLAGVCKNGKWGYIDKEGNEIVSCEYESCLPLTSQGVALAQKNGCWRTIRFYKYDA